MKPTLIAPNESRRGATNYVIPGVIPCVVFLTPKIGHTADDRRIQEESPPFSSIKSIIIFKQMRQKFTDASEMTGGSSDGIKIRQLFVGQDIDGGGQSG